MLEADPLVDQSAADRLNVATAATKARKQDFGAKPVANILQRPGPSYPYKLQPENVLSQVWKSGPAGSASVASVLKAARNAPDAVDAIKAGAAASLRRAALNDDGTLDPKKFAAWRAAHAEPLKTLDAVSPGSSGAFETAAKAGEHLSNVAQERKNALSAYEKSAVGKLLNVSDPSDVVKTVGGILGRQNSVQLMREVAAEARKDPAAFEGLRRAIVQHAEDKLISNTEAGTSGKPLIKSDQFQTFLGKNYTALRQVFSDEELGAWRGIAQDLKRANRSVTAVKLPGQSNTAQDLAAVSKHGTPPSLLHLAAHALRFVVPGLGYMMEGPTGLMAGLATNYAAGLLGSLRAAGISKMDDLLTEAMLNPKLAKTLMLKAPKRAGTGSLLTLGNVLRGLAVGLPAVNVATHQ